MPCVASLRSREPDPGVHNAPIPLSTLADMRTQAEAVTKEMRADVRRGLAKLQELDERIDRLPDVQELCESKLARYRFKNR
jgi:hypothetical protein